MKKMMTCLFLLIAFANFAIAQDVIENTGADKPGIPAKLKAPTSAKHKMVDSATIPASSVKLIVDAQKDARIATDAVEKQELRIKLLEQELQELRRLAGIANRTAAEVLSAELAKVGLSREQPTEYDQTAQPDGSWFVKIKKPEKR